MYEMHLSRSESFAKYSNLVMERLYPYFLFLSNHVCLRYPAPPAAHIPTPMLTETRKTNICRFLEEFDTG